MIKKPEIPLCPGQIFIEEEKLDGQKRVIYWLVTEADQTMSLAIIANKIGGQINTGYQLGQSEPQVQVQPIKNRRSEVMITDSSYSPLKGITLRLADSVPPQVQKEATAYLSDLQARRLQR